MPKGNEAKKETREYETSEIEITIIHHEPHWSDRLSGEDDYYTIETEGRENVHTDALGVLSTIIELIEKM